MAVSIVECLASPHFVANSFLGLHTCLSPAHSH